MTYGEPDVDQAIDRLLSAHPEVDAAAGGALDNLDQFHIGGAEAVDLLIPGLALTEGDVVLDVGSGFGGPARQIARRTGNHVVGVDITPAYVDAARELTARAGLAGSVRFHAGDIASFHPDAPFAAALTLHVQMNVPGKTVWFRHIAERLAPGARLAVWEVCQPHPADLPWPMPWSLDGTDSFVVPPEELLASVQDAGFAPVEWANESAWVKEWLDTTFADGLPAGPALPMLLDDGYTRVLNYVSALTDGTLEVWRGTFTKKST